MALLHKSHPGTAQAGESGPGSQPVTGPAHARSSRNWKRTAILAGVAVVLLVAAYFILGAFIPRWWSQRIGSAVHGSFTSGTVLGLCIGFTFTLVPLFVLSLALRPRTRWKLRIGWFVLALVLAAPNLATLTVVAGDGSGAHAGQRTMDVDAPAFRGASLAGLIIAVALYLLLMFFILRRRPGRRAKAKAVADVPHSA
jgi:glucan phosphoethanolaminetransferase (alkaline phosphatase superfamily)